MTRVAEKAIGADEAAIPAPAPAEKIEKHADKRRALGRGLESLLPSGPRDVRAGWNPPASGGAAVSEARTGGAGEETAAPGSPAYVPQPMVIAEMPAQAASAGPRESVQQIPLDKIDKNPYQTRVDFDEEALLDLTDSIRVSGVVSPIVVRPGSEGRYVLVLGERRCRASKAAGKTTIPALVRRISDQQAAEMTVVENLQRQDLNCIEQAAAFQKLSQSFGLTQTEIGERVGLSRESVANYMRLLRLPGTVMQYLAAGSMGYREARELLKLEDNEVIEPLAKRVIDEQLSFIALQDMVEKLTMQKYIREEPQQPSGRARWQDPNVRAAQQELQRVLGLRVRITDRKGKGKIMIEYASVDDYERVVGMLRR